MLLTAAAVIHSRALACLVLQPAERALCCSLLNVLAEHLNAEVVAGTIGSKQDAMDYITWTYFIRRLIRNPT